LHRVNTVQMEKNATLLESALNSEPLFPTWVVHRWFGPEQDTAPFAFGRAGHILL
jgi:hypothetical protein